MITKLVIRGIRGKTPILFILIVVIAVLVLIKALLGTRDQNVTISKSKILSEEEVTIPVELVPEVVMTERRRATDNNRRVIRAIETSSKTFLSYRQACSLESAAKFNPDMDVVLYMLSMDESTLRSEIVQTLTLSYENFKIERLNASELFRETKLEKWYEGEKRRQSPFQVEHLSDVMRYALIYNKGGIYTDLDVYFIKSLEVSRNFITLTKDDIVVQYFDNYMFGFSKPNHPVLGSVLATLESTYNPFYYFTIGPEYLWNKAETYCFGREVPLTSTWQYMSKMLKSDCDVKVQPANNSIWSDVSLFIPFYNLPDNIKELKSSHVHVKNKASNWFPVQKSLKSPFIKLMEFSCPKIFSLISLFESI